MTPPKTRRAYDDGVSGVLFDVTREIIVGSVLIGEGDLHPHAAAMAIIGDTMEEGVYRFPMEDGRTAEVSVRLVTPD